MNPHVASLPTPRHWPDDPRMPGLTLAQTIVIFARRRSPQLLAMSISVLSIARLFVGDLGVWDLALAASLVAFQPFSEWLIHVFILHWRPRKLGPLTIDSYLSWSHREHHKKPHDETWWFIPLRSGIIGHVAVGAVGALLLPTLSLWLTLMLTATVLGLIYEWTHYLCHAAYRPRSELYKRIVRHHRWHHFKNEHYWMGVSRHFADHVLGTNPHVKDVETSPTCRDLLAQGQR